MDLYVEPQELVNVDGEMRKVDSHYETKTYNLAFVAMHDPNAKEPPSGGSYNAITKCNVNDGMYEYWTAGIDVGLHEVAFVPRSPDALEADGFIISIVNRPEKMLTDIGILDTEHIAKGSIAPIELPFRLRTGFMVHRLRKKTQLQVTSAICMASVTKSKQNLEA